MFNKFKKKEEPKKDIDLGEAMRMLMEIDSLMGENNAQSARAVSESATERDDYGFSVDNPVYVTSIMKEYAYVAGLRTADGRELKCDRAGSTGNSYGEIVDIYDVYVGGRKADTIYICPYGRRNAETAPKGYRFYGRLN